MPKLSRSRSRPPPFPKASQEMRKPAMPPPTQRSCGASYFVLLLLASFGLLLLIAFALTLRSGHTPEGRESLEAVDEMEQSSETKSMALNDAVGVYGYEIIQRFKHDPGAFTQGLAFAGNGTLYESTGMYGKSSVRTVDLSSGKVRQVHQMKTQDFGEGLTIWKDRLLQVLWRNKKVIVYDKETLDPIGELHHQMQDGWGLTSNNDHVIGSDGTSKIYFMDPNTMKEIRVVTVKDGGKEVGWLNELEFIDNEIWANVWQGNCIAKISPQDGRVTGWILLHGLGHELVSTGHKGIDVLNGIAWDGKESRLYVTGKLWPTLYHIQIVPRSLGGAVTLQDVQRVCNVGHEGFR